VPDVVLPEISYPGGARQLQAAIVGRELAAMVPRQVVPFEPRVAERFDDSLRIVGAAVADDENLDIAKGLQLDGSEGAMERRAPIVGGQYDAD